MLTNQAATNANVSADTMENIAKVVRKEDLHYLFFVVCDKVSISCLNKLR